LTNGTGGGGSIQKLLATTRIQQEIEEQTQRELALRANGTIKTISQERSDCKVSKLSDPIEKQAPGADANASPIMTSPSVEVPNEHLNLTNTANKMGKWSNNGRAAETKRDIEEINNEKNSFIKNVVSRQSKASASPVASIISRKPNISPLFGIGATKNISMHKFITSKGKALSSSTSSLANLGSNTQLNSAVSDQYQELKPPQFARGDWRGAVRRGSVSAESKIQEELKEMRAREEELRNDRTRFLGLSQCNLTMVGDETSEQTDHNALKRAVSNPNLSSYSIADEETDDSIGGKQFELGSGRKRNSLIARWEEIIQKEDNSK
jgi:hypothetical protein